MLQADNTDLFHPFVTKAHNCECQNLIFPLQMKPLKSKVKLADFIFCPSALRGKGKFASENNQLIIAIMSFKETRDFVCLWSEKKDYNRDF